MILKQAPPNFPINLNSSSVSDKVPHTIQHQSQFLAMAPKLPTRNPKTSSSSSSTPKKPSKRKFTPKTHTTAGVALGKSKKAKKDPKKKQAALLQRLEKELPKLNMITPVGVVKPKGKKKGKVFVEDREKMMRILNRVNDDKDGRIQSKLERSVRRNWQNDMRGECNASADNNDIAATGGYKRGKEEGGRSENGGKKLEDGLSRVLVLCRNWD